MAKARNFLVKKTGDAAGVATFLSKTGAFADQPFNLSVGPVVWWQAGARVGFPESLTKVAVDLLSTTGSGAGLKCCISLVMLVFFVYKLGHY